MNEAIWIDKDTPNVVRELLADHNLLQDEQIESVDVAGEGNMNVTLRVQLVSAKGPRSIIVKQSRPFVAKYNSIPAPLERIEYEAKFYELVAGNSLLKSKMPERLAWLPEQKILVLEDLGQAADATGLYQDFPAGDLPALIGPLVEWLAELHNSLRADQGNGERVNLKLRELNHEHIFVIPFLEPPAIDLDSVCAGLNAASLAIRNDERLRMCCQELGQLYLGDGPCLLHGDFYPGSWLMTAQGPKVIDPEFMFWGPAEFDLGVLVAHLHFIGVDEPMQELQPLLSKRYEQLDEALVRRFAAVEILRRLLGVAQLPLGIDLDARVRLIRFAREELTEQ